MKAMRRLEVCNQENDLKDSFLGGNGLKVRVVTTGGQLL